MTRDPLPAEVAAFVKTGLAARADPTKAGPMTAYMKTSMPFYGVQKPQRTPIAKAVKRRFDIDDIEQYLAVVEAVWTMPHREEKYLAVHLARLYPQYVTPASVPLYEKLIREGAWWDFVDELAIHLVGRVFLDERRVLRPLLDEWVHDDDLWIRRTAILAQIGHKKSTDQRMLFDYCLRCAGESEFFIQKAIGWALREYSRFAPGAVQNFIVQNRERLSALSVREGAKRLRRAGYVV